MSFSSAISLIMTLLAVVSVVFYVPIISDYAFWIAVAAYIILASTWHRFHWS
jgi:Sec-independent protein secretion pathway component TatC